MIDDEVRAMLRRRAGDVDPAPAEWGHRITRVDHGDDRSPTRRRPPMPLLVAAVMVVVLGLAGVLAARPDGGQRVGTVAPVTSVAPPPPAPDIRPLWPATTRAGLDALQRQADAGRRPDLLDPRAAAGQYLSDRFLAVTEKRVAFEVKEYRAGDNQSGEVPFVADSLPGTVLVRRLGGEGSLWYVVALTNLRLPVESAYDRAVYVTQVRPTTAGRLVTRLSNPDGAVGPDDGFVEVTAGEAVDVLRGPAGQGPGVVALVRLTGADGKVSLAEFDVTPTSRPTYCQILDQMSGERPESFVGSDEQVAEIEVLLAAAPPELAGDLATYRDHVRDHVDPAAPASQETVNWPAPVRAAIQRIDAHDARLCRGAP
ncbi:MAG: hypothetical protein ACRDZW_08985 [Acidimicrobiales bacterium]